MQIDPITFFAQIANFLVLVFLLKRFLYGPILNAMDERERRIRQRLESAAEREQQAENARREFETETARLQRIRGEELERVRQEVEVWRQESIRQARDEIQLNREQWQAGLGREQGRFLAELRERAVEQVQLIAREALRQLADARLESQIVDRFTQQLATLLPEQVEELASGLAGSGNRARLRTAFPLNDTQQRRICEAMQAAFGSPLDVEFDTDKTLICGIEALAGDQKFSWNVADYLSSLQRSFSTALEHEAAHG